MSDYNYSWSSVYAKAVLESDETQVQDLVVEAECAIMKRRLQPGLALREFRAMQIALDILKTIHKRRH